jgi:hypothetical protein
MGLRVPLSASSLRSSTSLPRGGETFRCRVMCRRLSRYTPQSEDALVDSGGSDGPGCGRGAVGEGVVVGDEE